MVMQEEAILEKIVINVKGVENKAWGRLRAQAMKERRNTGDVLTDAIDAYVDEKEEAESESS